MRYLWLSAISFLTAVPFADFAMPLVPWDDMRVKHAWNTAPASWESMGHPPAGTTIDLYIALKPCQESALIDALYKVSDPRHPRPVLLTTPPLAPLFTCAAAPFQIWRTPLQGTGRRTRPAGPIHARACQFLACTPRRAILLHLNDTRRRLADGHRRARVPGQPTARRVISALPACQDKRHDNPHGRLRSPRGAAHTHSSGRADDVLLHAGAAADTTQALLRSSSGAGGDGVGEARDSAVEPRH